MDWRQPSIAPLHGTFDVDSITTLQCEAWACCDDVADRQTPQGTV